MAPATRDPVAPAALLDELAALIRLPSASPGGEGAIAARIAERLRRCGVEAEMVESLPGRYSVGARIAGDRPGIALLLNGHMDTVPAGPREDWTHDPYDPVVRDGHVYGRGACDMKAGLAIALAMAELAARARDRMRGELVLHFAIGEERAERGTRSLLEAGFGADVGIVLEPTALRVAVAQRGRAHYRVTVRGRGGHAGAPDPDTNPILRLPVVVGALADHAEAVAARHPLLPRASCTPTIVEAGVADNVVPESCSIVADCRLLPGQTAERLERELRARLDAIAAAAPGCEYVVEPAGNGFPASETPMRSGFAERMLRLAEPFTGIGEPWGTPYASDVGWLVSEGDIEAVTFGPGSIEHAHAPDERVEVEQVAAAARVVAAAIGELLLGESR